MPIDMAPPSPNIQGYNIPPPQSVDPLQTLSQMGQLRQQALQSQNAQMELQQRQIVLQDQQAMQQAMQQWDGKDPKTLFDLMRQGGVSAPSLLDVQTKLLDQKQKMATLDTSTLTNHQTRNTQAQSLLQPVTEETDPQKQGPLWNQAVTSAAQQGLLTDPAGNPLTADQALAQHPYPGPEGVKRYVAGLNLDKWLVSGKDIAETEASKATTAKTNIEAANAERSQVAQEIRAAPTDQTTGTIAPNALAEIRARHPNVPVPDLSTPGAQERFIRSTVPADKLPEYDMAQMKVKLGVFGNSDFDQYIAQYARGVKDAAHPNGMTPVELSPEQFRAGFKQYKADSPAIDPNLLSLMLGEKRADLATKEAQVATLPTPDRIKQMARDIYSGAMAPDQMAMFKTRSVNFADQVYDEVQNLAKADGVPFDWGTAEARYQTRKGTEDAFAHGKEAQMVRSFGNLFQHLPQLDEARKLLPSNNYPAMRAIANSLGIAAGSDAQTTYDLIADYVSNEASSAMLPGGGSEAERAATRRNLDRNLGDTQLAKNIKALAPLVNAQRENLERQYSEGTFGRGSRIGNLFDPRAVAEVNRMMGKTPAGPAGGPAVKTGKVPPPAGYTMQWPDGTTRSYTGKLPASDKNNWTIVVTK